MRYAVLSDIHGNLPALQAVMEDAKSCGVDDFLFAGDYCLSLPYPNEVMEILREAGGCAAVSGNEEEYLRRLEGQDQSLWTDGQMQVSYWCMRNLRPENWRFLCGMPHRLDFYEQGIGIHVTHSSADFIGKSEHARISSSKVARRYTGAFTTHEALLEDTRSHLLQDAGFRATARTLSPGIYIFGHCHVQWHMEAEGRLFINPGSCGLPLDCCEAGAPYTILDIDGGDAHVLERRVDYDLRGLLEDMARSTQHQEAWVWSQLIVRELTTRHEHVNFFLQYAQEYAASIGDAIRPYTVKTWEDAYDKWSNTLCPVNG